MKTNPDCLFCKIVAGEIPSNAVAQSERVYAFEDINPAAPVHVLLVTKEHIASSASELRADHGAVLGELFELAATIAADQKLDAYRMVTNSGAGAGQTVLHLHFHLLGGWGRSAGAPKSLADETGG